MHRHVGLFTVFAKASRIQPQPAAKPSLPDITGGFIEALVELIGVWESQMNCDLPYNGCP